MPPVVMIHGLFGWGEERPLYGLGPPYFPMEELRGLWTHGPVVAVDVGIASSDHDRACEAFAQLLGLQVDYGHEHACRCGHERFGLDFRGEGGLLKRWNAQNPIHLVGHSFGGNTAVELFDMLSEDHWGIGTSSDWVLSVSCVCSPLRGCSLPFALGLDVAEQPGGREVLRNGSPTHLVAAACALLWKLQLHWPGTLRPLYNIRMEQWKMHSDIRTVVSATSPLWGSMDNILSEITPRYRRSVLRSRFQNLSKVYLIAVRADTVPPLAPVQAAVGATKLGALLLALTSWGAWRSGALRRKRREALLAFARRQLTALRPWLPTLLRLAACWAALAPLAAYATVRALCEPRLAGTRAELGLRMQRFLAPWRPFLHSHLARPMLRLFAWAVYRAHSRLPEGSKLVAAADDHGQIGHNDGMIDLMAQRGLDTPVLGRPPKWQQLGGFLRPIRSSTAIAEAKAQPLSRSFSHNEVLLNGNGNGGAQEDQLERGRWHNIHVPGTDHCLGTWLGHEHSVQMYQRVFGLLERSTRSTDRRVWVQGPGAGS